MELADYTAALKYLKIAYKEVENDSKQRIMFKIAKCYKKTNNKDHTIKAYEQAINLDNKHYLPYMK